MRKYQTEFKLEVVKSFLAGEGGAKLLARQWSVPEDKIRRWVNHFRSHGIDGLRPKRSSYSEQFKLQVLSGPPQYISRLLGHPGFEALNWYAFVGPAKTPTAILERWNREIVKVLVDEQFRKALQLHGLTPQPTTRQELAAFMQKEYEQWGKVVRERKLTAN